ncbi:hypothetical protein [Streptomyces sp. NPDC001478]
MSDVRELLGRAAEDAGHPVISTEVVYARAARVRRRRRAAVSAAAVCAVAAGAFVLPGLTAGPENSPQTASVAAPVTADGGRAERLAALLPKETGAIQQVSLAQIIKNATPAQAKEKYYGPLDGQYAVRRDGGVGYLTISLQSAKFLEKKRGGFPPEADLCHPGNGEPAPTDCVREALPDGRVLTLWSDAMEYGAGTLQWGPELVARLTLKDGSELAVRDSTGFESDRSQGPLLKTPPLTREQLRALVLRPELVAKK